MTVDNSLPALPAACCLLPQWREAPARSYLAPRIGCPVYLLNDVRMATLGELLFGHGRSEGNLACFALGTGIGGGFAVDGRLHLGPMGASAEFGHMTVAPDSPHCSCGSRGCLETYAGGPAIAAQGVRLLLAGQTTQLHELVAGDPGRVTPRKMAQAAAEGDEAVHTVLVRAAEYLGIGVANVILVLHPQLVVLGGSVDEIGPLLFDTVRATVKQRAGLLGGVALAMKRGES